MMYYTCQYCGDNLDPGEKCECQKAAVPTRHWIRSHGQYKYITRQYNLSKLTFITKLDGKVEIYERIKNK